MPELWDIYDKNKNVTGRVAERDVYKFKEGEYHLVVVALIINSKNEILITKRSATKNREPLKWELTGGGVSAEETSLQGILRETQEEIGMKFTPEEAIFLKEIRRDRLPSDFKDLWLFKNDTPINEIKFEDGEVCDAKWVTMEEFLEIKENKEMISTIDFEREDYDLALKKLTLK